MPCTTAAAKYQAQELGCRDHCPNRFSSLERARRSNYNIAVIVGNHHDDGAGDGASDGVGDGAGDGVGDGAGDGVGDGAGDGVSNGASDGAGDGYGAGDSTVAGSLSMCLLKVRKNCKKKNRREG